MACRELAGVPLVSEDAGPELAAAPCLERIVAPTEYSVIKRVGYDRLVLTACHPLYSAAKRIVVFARLVREQPLGAAAKSTENRSSPAA